LGFTLVTMSIRFIFSFGLFLMMSWNSVYAQTILHAETVEGKTLAFTVLDGSTCAVGSQSNRQFGGEWGQAIEKETTGVVTIPSVVEGYRVVRIARSAFEECSKITKINIPNSITYIGTKAFRGCEALTSCIIPESITEIGESAFGGCAFDTLVIPDGVKKIGREAFSGNRNLVKVRMGKGTFDIGRGTFSYCRLLKTIEWCEEAKFWVGHQAFSHCDSLEEVVLPYTAVSVGDSAFWACSNLKCVNVGPTVQKIGIRSFAECKALSEFIVPEENKKFDEVKGYAFEKCTSLKSFEAPETVNKLGEGAFHGCNNLTQISLSNRLQRIEQNTFAGCEKLSSPKLPESLYYIGPWAFNGCRLRTIVIPKNVSKIDEWAFSYAGLGTVYLMSGYGLNIGYNAFASAEEMTVYSFCTRPYSIDDMAFSFDAYQYGTLYVPNGCQGIYKSTDGWRNFNYIKSFDTSSVKAVKMADNSADKRWFNLGGHLSSKQPSKSGIYINSGKKVLLK